MLDAVEQHDIDLVVMGRGGYGQRNLGWVGSTCHKMVRSSRCPFLIMPECPTSMDVDALG
jgi:nucleotide-binding universal stress UspA family protein